MCLLRTQVFRFLNDGLSFCSSKNGFLGGPDGKASAYNVGDLGSIPGQEDPLEKAVATHSSTLAWEIPWEDAGRLQSMGS